MAPAIPLIAIALTVAATGYGVYSSVQAASAAKKTGDYNSQLAATNAANAKSQTDADVEKIRRQNYLTLSSQQAAYGASGVDAGSGSPLDVGYDSQVQGQQNILDRQYQGTISENNFGAQGQLAEMSASSAEGAAYSQAGTTLLSGLSKAGGQAYSTYGQPATTNNSYGSPTLKF